MQNVPTSPERPQSPTYQRDSISSDSRISLSTLGVVIEEFPMLEIQTQASLSTISLDM